MEVIRIVLLALVAAVGYGIAHDQITARICVEYFTIGHPPIFATRSPTLLAFGWGVVATWWVGLPLGYVLALAARAGRRPKLTASFLRRPIVVLLLTMGVSAAVAGTIGGLLAARGSIWLAAPFDHLVPPARHAAFLADLWAHSASYFTGIIGGVALAIWTWRARTRLNVAAPT